jgi:hypothetical protein
MDQAQGTSLGNGNNSSSGLNSIQPRDSVKGTSLICSSKLETESFGRDNSFQRKLSEWFRLKEITEFP